MNLKESKNTQTKLVKQEKTVEDTKEELARKYREYYKWLNSIYPIEGFEISGKNNETLYFHHANNLYHIEQEEQDMIYYLRDIAFKEYAERIVKAYLQGEKIQDDREFEAKAFIQVDKREKKFRFSVEFDFERNGYGRAIYNNYLHILDMLGIEDKEQYVIQVLNKPNHPFLQKMHTEALVAKTNQKPDTNNALQILEEFAKSTNRITLNEITTIASYAIASNVPVSAIGQALNESRFNIFFSAFKSQREIEEEIEQFRALGITGLKATCMHEHFMREKSFRLMSLITQADREDTTLEFRRIFEEIKADHEKRKAEGAYITSNLAEFGELEHLILDWKHSGLLFRNVTPDIQELVKMQAISKFEEFDPEHSKPWEYSIDDRSFATFKVLKEAGLMDKEAYIALYQKALNRNYDLTEFDGVVISHISEEERVKAREEIEQHTYYPAPKKKWQRRTNSWSGSHRIAKVTIPKGISQKGKVRDLLKQHILQQGVAKNTKIKTDMMGKGKDGKPFIVDNLKDWLFGVPGTHGNLQMMGTNSIALPPQTPKFAVQLLEKAFKEMEHLEFGER